MTQNIDKKTVGGFGDEWTRFDQSALSTEEQTDLFKLYFQVFPWDRLPKNAQGFDAGCGSGRWAQMVAPRVGKLTLVDASEEALAVARRNLQGQHNVEFACASVNDMPLAPASQDFGYSLGVLHHIPDTLSAMKACTQKLKPGAPFLVYLYFRFDNKPFWFRSLWWMSNLIRQVISRMPMTPRYFTSQIFAFLVYWPLARFAWLCEKLGLQVGGLPLAGYRHRSFYTMRTDALDRFGTRLEQRFTKAEIQDMMTKSDLKDITFCTGEIYWCAAGIKV